MLRFALLLLSLTLPALVVAQSDAPSIVVYPEGTRFQPLPHHQATPELQATLASWRKWTAYREGQSLSEPEFFLAVGREDLALRAQRYQRTNTAGLITGLTIMGAGLVAGGLVYERDDRSVFVGKYMPALTLSIIGGGVTGWFGGRMGYRSTPYGTAVTALK